MKIVIYLTDGGVVDIENFESASSLDLVEELREGEEKFLTLDLGDGVTTLVNKDQITRVDFG